MPTPTNELPPRGTWEAIFAAGKKSILRDDGTPCLQGCKVVQRDPDKVLRSIRKPNGKVNRYLRFLEQ